MTFDTIVTTVLNRLNLTTQVDYDRVAVAVNDRYKRLAVDCGIKTIAKTVATATTTIGSQYLTFGPSSTSGIGVVKMISMFNTNFNPYMVMTEMSFQELRNQIPGTDPPRMWAVVNTGAEEVECYLNAVPSAAYLLSADVLAVLDEMSGTDVPAFPVNYHMLLVYGAMADEYDHLEKPDFADKKEKQYEDLSSRLKYLIATSAYKDIVQGKDNYVNPWWSQPVT